MFCVKPSHPGRGVAALALALACAACAVPAPRVVDPGLAPADDVRADATPWWTQAGDPVLAQVIAQGLAHDARLACDAWQLQAQADRLAARRRHLGGRLTGLMAAERVADGVAPGAYAHAALVNRRAAAMAEAYLAVRLAQARLAARRSAAAPWQDNTEIARFRREAGLVSAIDGALGGVMVDLDTDAVTQAETDVSQAMAHLAEETGLAGDALVALMGQGGAVPTLNDMAAPDTRRAGVMLVRQEQGQAVVAGTTSVDQARAALASATAANAEDMDSAAKALEAARQLAQASARTLAQADRTVRDARAGYRAGAEPFATLYVAEASALAAGEADATARAGLARAQVRLWTAHGLGWTAADLAPAAPAQAPSQCSATP
ncbi:hypothetical protein IP65_01535 [Novosphingobium sp. AAP1]|nr:hypothetical protein IP65_01535 [Novosphingobium sp. AAP1]